MRWVLAALSLVLPIVPFTILMPSASSPGLVIILVILSIGIVGLLMNNPSMESWAALIIALLVSITSQGYVPYLLHAMLIPIQNAVMFNGSIVIIEYSLVTSQLYGSYVRYIRELSARGYDRGEVNEAVNELIEWVLALLAVSLLISLAIYYVVAVVTTPLIDPFTALVIFAVTYIVISRYVLSRMRGS